MTDPKKEDLRPYRIFGLSMLKLMLILFIIGIVLAVVFNFVI